MSFLKNLEKVETKLVVKKPEIKPIVKQKGKIVIQTKATVEQDTFKINPEIKTIDDIPNTNIMTSGKLIGVRLRTNKKKMLEQLRSYIDNLLEK